MSDLEKLFKHAPEGAVELRMLTDGGCARWFNKGGKYFSGSAWLAPMHEYKTIATRPQQTKTVADAYEWHVRIYGTSEWRGVADCINLNPNNGEFDFGYKSGKTICTREQFEAYAKEQEAKQEGEKWTHTYKGEKCYIKVDEPDFSGCVVIFSECEEYQLIRPDELDPIKPKLTESAMLSRIYKIARGTLSDAECGDKIKELFDTTEII